MDESSLLILRALAGETRKVEIGGRRYTFSCVPSFQLRDDGSGRMHHCADSRTLLMTVRSLLSGDPGRINKRI